MRDGSSKKARKALQDARRAGCDGYYKGSCRSVDGFNVHDALTEVQDLLITYGGHAQAAGVSVSKDNYDKLNFALNNYAESVDFCIDGEQKVYAEWEVDKPFSMRFAHELELLEPFGVGNRKPLFVTNVNSVDSLPLKAGSLHFSFNTSVVEMLDFNGEKNVTPLSFSVNKKIVFELNLSVFKNRESMKGFVRNVVVEYENFDGVMNKVFSNEMEKLMRANQNSEQIIDENTAFYDKHKTVFVLSNPKNLERYPQVEKLPISFFVADKLGGQIVVAPRFLSEEIERVVYLDKPLSFSDYAGQSYLIANAPENFYAQNISVEREIFAKIFNQLCMLNGRRFKSADDFVLANLPEENAFQAIFCLTVFFDLKIFSVKDGIFTYNQNVKNALTNSKVYSKIYTLKV